MPVVLVALVLAAIAVYHFRVILGLALAAVLAARLAYAAVRFAMLPRAAMRHYPAACWHRLRWRALARRLDLARPDPHRAAVPVPAASTALIRDAGRRWMLYPRARFRADPYGLRIRIRTVPGTGRAEVDAHAEHLANALGACRVSVSQPSPRRLEVRAFRRDPLAEPLSVTDLARFDGRHLILGRDELGELRRVSLANHSGSCWSGNPGRGKSEAALSLMWQVAPSPAVEVYILDGGALDWEPFAPGAAAYVTDLDEAVDVLHDLAAGMNKRRRTLAADLGVRNAWERGPSPEFPLRWVVIEEAPAFLDQTAHKGDKKREALAWQAHGLVAGLLRRGRAPLYHVSLICQKASTTGGLHPDLRDLCGLRWSFGVATADAAAGILGGDIRGYESLSPVNLQGDQHVGIASCLLPTNGLPYTLLKFPAVGQAQADAAALELARRHPVPADLADLEPAGSA